MSLKNDKNLSPFGQRLIDLMVSSRQDCDTAPKLAKKLLDAGLVKVNHRNTVEQYIDLPETQNNAIKSVKNKIEAHIHASGPEKLQGEYALAYSIFFGVSTDYLLMRTDIKSPDINVKEICKYTGLTEEAVYTLINSSKSDVPNNAGWVSLLLEEKSFYRLTGMWIAFTHAYVDYKIKDAKLDSKKRFLQKYGGNDTIANLQEIEIATLERLVPEKLASVYGSLGMFSNSVAAILEEKEEKNPNLAKLIEETVEKEKSWFKMAAKDPENPPFQWHEHVL